MKTPFMTAALALTCLVLCEFPLRVQAADAPSAVPLRWLDESAPALPQGASWGVPWARGVMKKDQTFALKTADGKLLPVQTWPLAYWPDGSMKWTGVAAVTTPDMALPLTLVPGAGAPEAGAVVRVRNSDTTVEVDTGKLKCRIVKWGGGLIDSMMVDGREIARKGQLVCILQDGPDGGYEDSPHKERFIGNVEKVTVEQNGPVRAVVKIEGKHQGVQSQRQWLPFIVRLYFYAGEQNVKMVHTIIYDGDEKKDFIRGLGVQFAVPMREEIQNRHVRFGGEGDGLWAEPIQPMKGRDGRFVADPNPSSAATQQQAPAAQGADGDGAPPAARGGRGGRGGRDVYPDQVAGKRVPNKAEVDARGQGWLADWAVWDSFKLIQPNADGFTIVKRTNADSCWLPAGAGKRSSGLAFVGDVSGGLAVSLKNFWQSYPASLEVAGASTGSANLIAWMWSPDAPAMDMRHYDTRAHGLEAVYEDVQEGMSIPMGVARTSELTLFATSDVPEKSVMSKMAQFGEKPGVLLCTNQYLHDAQAFGIWGLEDRSTPVKRGIEDGLKRTVDYYLTQPDQRNWYGFWDFGDVMHSYDTDRHVWRYDLGGMAWDNSELGTDMWLWYSFLHTGRADIFRMAEAMSRHTGEVDTYHIGPFAGLGSRHNVRHWGCGAKEARISQAGYRRFYYYLTTDERTGDVMRDVLNADFKTIEFDPMRLAQPITPGEKLIAPTRVRLGPDWFAFVGNWMTEYERTGDKKWRDKIEAGVQSLAKMPLGLRTGRNLVFGYDPKSGQLFQLDDSPGLYNLATIMGGAETVFELNMMLDDPQWETLWLRYCRLYSNPQGMNAQQVAELIKKDFQTNAEGADAAYTRDGRMAAYVYTKTGNPAFLQVAIDALLGRAAGGGGRGGGRGGAIRRVDGPDVVHPVDEGPSGTNGAAQNGLETITMLGMVGDKLPAELPPQQPGQTPGRGRGGRGRGGRG
jgi:hypothetical protein